jgi:hypothetical protein
MELLKSAALFAKGILKRFYYWVPPIFLDPFDLYEHYIQHWLPAGAPERLAIPTWVGLLAFALLFGWAALRTFHELRLKVAYDTGNSASQPSKTSPVAVSPLKFAIKVESIIQRSATFLDEGARNYKTPPCLVLRISFKTNQAIQIASLHLEIDSTDPRDIIEPSPHLTQGFQLPHTLLKPETHEFQFEILPHKAKGKRKMLLKVLAGGDWYTDGPYSISFS